MLIKQGSFVQIRKSHPAAGKVGIVAEIAICDISREFLVKIRLLDDQGEPYEVLCFPPDIRGWSATSQKTMQAHAEHRQQRRDRATA